MKRFVVIYEDESLEQFEGCYETLKEALDYIRETNEEVAAENKLTIKESKWSWHIFEIKKSHHFTSKVSHTVESWEEPT